MKRYEKRIEISKEIEVTFETPLFTGDVGNTIGLEFYLRGKPYEFTSATLFGTNKAGETVFTTAKAEGHTVVLPIVNAMFQVPVKADMQVVLYDDSGNALTSGYLHFTVIQGLSENASIEGTDEYNSLMELLAQVNSSMGQISSGGLGKEGTVETAEIFNDYENNKAYVDYSHAEGYKTVAGARKKLEIISYSASSSETYITLDTAEGIRVNNIVEITTVTTPPSGNDEPFTSTAEYTVTRVDGNAITVDLLLGEYDSILTSEGLYNLTPSGKYSHAEGDQSQAIGDASHAEGARTKAIGPYSHAEGGMTETGNPYAHSEGFGTTANGMCSHAEGMHGKANGVGSHAEGRSTTAEGMYSHVGGVDSMSIGDYSFSHGQGAVAKRDYSIALGRYPEIDEDVIFSLGTGTSDSDRSSAIKVAPNGDVTIKRNLIVDTISARSMNFECSLGVSQNPGWYKFASAKFASGTYEREGALLYISNYYPGTKFAALVSIIIDAADTSSHKKQEITFTQIAGNDITDKLAYCKDPDTNDLTFYIKVEDYQLINIGVLYNSSFYGAPIEITTDNVALDELDSSKVFSVYANIPATKATQDENGNNIVDTYATKEEIGEISTALTEIEALQNSYIGGDSV